MSTPLEWLDLALERLCDLARVNGGPDLDFARDLAEEQRGSYVGGSFSSKKASELERWLRQSGRGSVGAVDARLVPYAAYLGECARDRFGGGQWGTSGGELLLVLFQHDPLGPYPIFPSRLAKASLARELALVEWLDELASFATEARSYERPMMTLEGSEGRELRAAVAAVSAGAGDGDAMLSAVVDGLFGPAQLG